MKKNLKKARRALTLVEIMVVIMLITMITGTVAYNYSKSIDKGREFKTKQIKERVLTILNLAVAEGDLDLSKGDFATKWKEVVTNSHLVKDGANFTVDANNKPLDVKAEKQDDGSYIITVK